MVGKADRVGLDQQKTQKWVFCVFIWDFWISLFAHIDAVFKIGKIESQTKRKILFCGADKQKGSTGGFTMEGSPSSQPTKE
jgi:hypothetical protein